MSAAGTCERMATPDGVIGVAMDYLSIELTPEQAAKFTMNIGGNCRKPTGGWMSAFNATSVGPVIYLKNRLLESGIVGEGLAEDDSLPIVHLSRRGGLVAAICAVARSKMFRTPLIVEPIDLVAGRVSGLGRIAKAEPT